MSKVFMQIYEEMEHQSEMQHVGIPKAEKPLPHYLKRVAYKDIGIHTAQPTTHFTATKTHKELDPDKEDHLFHGKKFPGGEAEHGSHYIGGPQKGKGYHMDRHGGDWHGNHGAIAAMKSNFDDAMGGSHQHDLPHPDEHHANWLRRKVDKHIYKTEDSGDDQTGGGGIHLIYHHSGNALGVDLHKGHLYDANHIGDSPKQGLLGKMKHKGDFAAVKKAWKKMTGGRSDNE